MTVVGLNFTKFLAEKSKPIKGQISIKNNVSITGISESKLNIDAKKKALKFEFVYNADYEPGIGKIEIGGEVIFLADEKTAKEALDKWKKEKKAPSEVGKSVMNHALSKCNIQAIVLSKDLNLPAPIQLPKIK
jgi:hypothetical protein